MRDEFASGVRFYRGDRPDRRDPEYNYFDSGRSSLMSKILRWTIDKIKKTPKKMDNLPLEFESFSSYQSVFLRPILEETRATVFQGFELYESNRASYFEAKITKIRLSARAESISTLFLEIQNERVTKTVKTGDVFLFEVPKYLLLAIATYVPPSKRRGEISLKIILPGALRDDVFCDDDRIGLGVQSSDWILQKGSICNLYAAGSIITFMRMYDAFNLQNRIVLAPSLLTGEITNEKFPKSNKIREWVVGPEFNLSQTNAIRKFLNLKQGIQLIQGPPGTGKTSTIIELLRLLVQSKTKDDAVLVSRSSIESLGRDPRYPRRLLNRPGKIVVTAPSNKAVQLLAERFTERCPDVVCALVGVEEKLPQDKPALARIFIHTWEREFFRKINLMQDKLEEISGLKFLHEAQEIINFVSNVFDEVIGSLERYAFISKTEDWIEKIKLGLKSINILTQNSSQLESLLRTYFEALGKLKKLVSRKTPDEVEKQLLRASKVIFATQSVSGRKSMRELERVKVLITDEAAQSVEAETVIPVLNLNPKKWLLVGDTKQLPATVLSQELKKIGFDRSLMERFEIQGSPSVILDTQYRMHSSISVFPRHRFYADKLNDDKVPVNLPDSLRKAPPHLAPYAFIDVIGQEEKMGSSYVNYAEIDAIKRLFLTLTQKFHVKPEQVGIITFYQAQVVALQEKLANYPGISIRTVDGFQGGENDIILISFVRVNPKTVGFLDDFRRLNVAFTRARYSLLMVGHADTLMRQEDLQELHKHVKEQGVYFCYDKIKATLRVEEDLPPVPQAQPQQKKVTSQWVVSDEKSNQALRIERGLPPMSQSQWKKEWPRLASQPQRKKEGPRPVVQSQQKKVSVPTPVSVKAKTPISLNRVGGRGKKSEQKQERFFLAKLAKEESISAKPGQNLTSRGRGNHP